MSGMDADGSSRSRPIDALVWDMVWPVDLPGDDPIGNDWSRLDEFRAAGVNLVGVTLAGDQHDLAEAVRLVGWAHRCVRERADRAFLVTSAAECEAVTRDARIGVLLQFEGTECFGRSLDSVEVFWRLGVRQTLLAFNTQNSAGGGCADPVDAGLTAWGRRLVAEFDRVGMLVDLSHTGRRTSLDVLHASDRPRVFSHSNADRVAPHFRNVTDEQIRACAATGGVVGISGASEYLGDPAASTRALFAHVDHVVQLVGPAHAALGLDVVADAAAVSAWMRARPDEWPTARDPAWPGVRYATHAQLGELVALMRAAGYPDDAVRDVLGRNWLRVCRHTWR